MRPQITLRRSAVIATVVSVVTLIAWLLPPPMAETSGAVDGRLRPASPAPSSPHPAARPRQVARLQVVNGAGSGQFQAGEPVYVEPYRLPDMRVFDQWAGRLPPAVRWPATTRAHMTFTMPASDVVITGTLRPAALWALRERTTANGARIFHHPPAPFYGSTGGAIVLLHDAGQGADVWRQSMESRLFQRAAVARGHGILVLESSDRATGRWDTTRPDSNTNPDLRRLLDAIGTAGLGGPPLVLLGVGQGGEFAALAARSFLPLSSVHVVGTVLVGSAGLEPRADAPVATMFVLAERDDPGVNDRAAIRAAALRAQGTAVELLRLPPWPMTPTRMWRIDGLSLDDAVEVYKVLLRRRILDPVGRVMRDPAGLADPGLPAELARSWPHVQEQLVAGWAGHGFSSLGAEDVLRFAENRWGLPVPQPTPTATRRAYAAQISITDGSKGKGEQSGSTAWYGDQDLVHIWANPDPDGRVFDRWTGTIRYLADPLARHTTLRVLDVGCCAITATYRAAPAWQPEAREIEGRQVYLHVPPDPVGLVFFFHGAGGSAAGWIGAQNGERWLLLRDAAARGYAVAVTESGDRQGRQWSPLDPPADNPDIQHLARLQAALLSSGQLPAGRPTFGVGMSNGGGFVSRAADALGWQGAAVYAAACHARNAETTTVPLVWLLAENDRRVSNQDAYGCHQRLAERGIHTALHVNPPSPVYPERFWRLPGVDAAGSRAAYDALRSARLLDRLDFQHLPPLETKAAWEAAITAAGTLPLNLAAEQLDLTYAEHQFFSDLNHRTLDFFDGLRGVGPWPTSTPRTTATAGTPGTPATAARTPTRSGTPGIPVWRALLPAVWQRR